jgi:two-component system chemotaxis sensor kinase CheA
VVKHTIEKLHGTIDIQSHPGKGTTINLKLPLTLAIIDGLLVSVADTNFVLPITAIEKCLEFTHRDLEKAQGRKILNLNGKILPFISLRERFGITGDPPALQRVVASCSEDRRIGIVVDKVIGEQQIVIKSMSRLYRHVEEISGATVLGNGSVALILDIAKLITSTDVLASVN